MPDLPLAQNVLTRKVRKEVVGEEMGCRPGAVSWSEQRQTEGTAALQQLPW